MNKSKLSCLALIFASGVTQAANPCNGFEIKIKNSLAENLLVRKIELHGAELNPAGIQHINSNSEEVFTVSNSSDKAISGEFILNTISIPSKEVKIKFNLANTGVICLHDDQSPDTDLPVEKTRLPGKVHYTIHN
jgi:hypothetical protein